MSTPKIAVITAASIGMVLTQSSSLLAEKQDASAAQKVTKIAAPIDLDEEVLYSVVPDEVLEVIAGGQPNTARTTMSKINICGPGGGGTNPVNKKVPPLSKSPKR
jgi:hypothetical protein